MIAVILAGGSGTRFWPLSRKAQPKQLVDLFGDAPMIRHTVRRVAELADHTLVVTGDALLEATKAAAGLPDSAFVVEPAARNTAPAIALAAVVARERFGDEPIAVLPSDHYIADEPGFRDRLRDAQRLAEDRWIVTLGIRPTRPETGYGYIRAGEQSVGAGFQVDRFVEKPDVATALEYLASGNYLWNAGIFVFRPSALLAELERQKPEMYSEISRIADSLATDDSAAVIAEVFPQLERVSIDYAVMEGAQRIAVVPADVGWSDVGHWAALESVLPRDSDGNVTEGRTVLIDVEDSVVFNRTAGVTAVLGMRDVVVVHTDDAVLVLPRDRAQDVRQIVAALEASGDDFT